LNNIAKHSRADRVNIMLNQTQGGEIGLTIKDNGKGFNLKKVSSPLDTNRGFGLASMRERTEQLGGAFTIKSSREKGTSIQAGWSVEEIHST